MKKVWASLFILVITLTGCGEVQLSYLEKVKEAEDWAFVQEEHEGNVEIKLGEDLMTIDYTYTGYKERETEKSYSVLELWVEDLDGVGNVLIGKEVEDGESDSRYFKINSYRDGEMIYVSKAYLEAIQYLSGEEKSQEGEVIEEMYVTLEVDDLLIGEIIQLIDKEHWESFAGVEAEMEQVGHTYTVALTHEGVENLIVPISEAKILELEEIFTLPGEMIQGERDTYLSNTDITLNQQTTFGQGEIIEKTDWQIKPAEEVSMMMEMILGGEIVASIEHEKRIKKVEQQTIVYPTDYKILEGENH